MVGGILFVRHLEAGATVLDVSIEQNVRKDAAIIFFSGDTGLRSWSLGGRVARHLAAAGYSVTGVDDLAAFSQRKTPLQAARLLERAMNAAMARNPDAPLVLIGQSFGADIIPIAMNRLSPQLRGKISKIILIVPGRKDDQIASARLRRVATLHAIVAFLFNIGVVALTVNIVAGAI